jgi:hypothetical protein
MDAPWQVRRRGWDAYDIVMDQVRRDGDCLIFTGFIAANGYGRVETKATGEVGAHRVVAERHYGPSDLWVLHSCDRRECVEPSHLRYGTVADNGRDAAQRARMPRGTANPNAVLTPDMVRAIRADPRPSGAVAADLGIGSRTVRNVRTGRTWAWLT